MGGVVNALRQLLGGLEAIGCDDATAWRVIERVAVDCETLDTYSHLWPDSDDRTREAIDSVLGSADQARTSEAVGR